MRRNHLLYPLAVLLFAAGLMAQATTGTLTGIVTTDGAPLPGVTVTVSSPTLQGVKTAVSDANGVFNFAALPPGRYTVTYELAGMARRERSVQVNLAQSSRADVEMRVAAVEEAITVTATSPTVIETSAISYNIDAKTLENLPVSRTITGAARLAPGVSPEGPNDQLVIAGAPSYENLYLVNGAVVNDTVRGQPHSVYIEDAIAETTVLTGNVSAEYGRFVGGVVNTITKSGGNEFSGSLRDSLTNDDWQELTPFPGEAEHLDNINHVYEATLGGFVLRDRLWFFGAGRTAETSFARNTRDTNIPFTSTQDETRIEAKLTGQVTTNHSIVASYLDRERFEGNNSFGSITDLRSLDDRDLPESLKSASYSGIFGTNFLVEALWSERKFAFVGSGANSKDLIDGTIIRGFDGSRRAWSPTFCGICAPKTRDNEYMQVKGTYFLSTANAGTHNLIAGYEDFSELREENNEQGGSGWRLWGFFLHPNGTDTFIHVDPEESYLQVWPVLNASLRSDSKVRSFFINDRWDLSERWSFNIGARYDQNDSVDQAGKKTSDDAAFSPRLSATWDLQGDGRHRIIAGYGEYVAEIDNSFNDATSSAGSPAAFQWFYLGPEINGPDVPADQLLTTDQVLAMVFDWFFNENCGGVSPDDYATMLTNCSNPRSYSVPGVDSQLDGQLRSPTAREFSIGYGAALGTRGFVRADYINRTFEDFYTASTNLSNGTVFDKLGNEFDLTLVGNRDEGLERTYDAVTVQAGYRFLPRLNVGGNYTWSELRGNADSESSNSATDAVAAIDHFPEYLDRRWNNPVRAMESDVEHRANIWATYDVPTPIGEFNVSLLEMYHSGYPYFAVGSVDLREIENPGYLDTPSSAGYFFEGSRDYRTDDVTRTDLGLNYSLPIRVVELFVQAEVLNLFDESAINDPGGIEGSVFTSRNSACRQADGSRCARFNPKTETPVEGVHWMKDPDFGQADDDSAYQLPRTFRFSVGLRF
ncbi:MAG: TonB-dependent receptor [Thermoanaerobaculia bacterium]